MDIKEINSAKSLSEVIQKEKAKERLVAEAKREEHFHKKNELELSKESNQSSKESNAIARKANHIAILALAISIIALVVTILK